MLLVVGKRGSSGSSDETGFTEAAAGSRLERWGEAYFACPISAALHHPVCCALDSLFPKGMEKRCGVFPLSLIRFVHYN